MDVKRLTVSALAAVFAISGIGSILWMNHQPGAVEAIELSDDERVPAIRRPDDDGSVLEVVDDDDDRGDGDDTAGDDGSSGGNNTGDGDRTAGDDTGAGDTTD